MLPYNPIFLFIVLQFHDCRSYSGSVFSMHILGLIKNTIIYISCLYQFPFLFFCYMERVHDYNEGQDNRYADHEYKGCKKDGKVEPMDAFIRFIGAFCFAGLT